MISDSSLLFDCPTLCPFEVGVNSTGVMWATEESWRNC
jgi:hypothetical protein